MARISAQEAGGANVLAFLDMIAWSEGTSTSPATKNSGYDVIVTGIDKKPEIFTNYATHPFANGRPSKVINSKGLTSNASGRYQHMLKDWVHYKTLLKLPDFSAESQDRWAIQLIRERGALVLIQAGKFAQAVARVNNIWASLTGSNYGQPTHDISKLQAAYTKAGGSLSV